jgi:ubiquinone biosynthesis protein
MLERFAPHRVMRRARREALNYAQVIAEAPYQFHDFMEEIRDGQIEVGFVHKGLDQFLETMQNSINRLVVALIVVGGLIGSSMIGIFATNGPQLLGVNLLSVIGFALSTVLGIWLLWGVVRSGRL